MIKEKFKGLIADIFDQTIEKTIDKNYSLYNLLKIEARNEGLSYVKPYISEVLIFTDRIQNIAFSVDYALKLNASKDNLFLEFGVWKGKSLKLISKMIGDNSLCFGFDSFEGLQEDWVGTSMPKGFFNVNKNIPKISNPNCKFYVGFFDKTLPEFVAYLESNRHKQIQYIHIDSDTYPAANLILSTLSKYISTNTIITFDEYLGYPGWRNGEFKAFQEFVIQHNVKYKYISFSSETASIQIL